MSSFYNHLINIEINAANDSAIGHTQRYAHPTLQTETARDRCVRPDAGGTKSVADRMDSG